MRKIIFAEFGGPEVLHLVQAEEPHAGPGRIRIAVRAAGVNPVDWRIREGQVLGAHPVELPAGVGLDAAGVVDEIGEGVEGVEVGDRVFGEGADTYAEFAVLSAWARMPEGLAFEEAAGYPSVVETALRVIREVGVRPGQTLLVSGASGGVGSAVLQIARARGIAVIGTAGAANQDYLRGLGALATTYNEGWVERVRHLGRVDAALDLAGSGVIRELVELTGDPGKVVSIADLGAPRLGVRLSGVAGSVPDALTEAVDLISQGRLHIPVEKAYSLTEAAAAHTDSRAGHTRGRRVLVVRAETHPASRAEQPVARGVVKPRRRQTGR
ncbi:NADPH:quinone reductase [Streptomyces sp. PpalLS-921]|nr:NADPH:quinone reductase [Streptomyces sp. PpalLS-921]